MFVIADWCYNYTGNAGIYTCVQCACEHSACLPQTLNTGLRHLSSNGPLPELITLWISRNCQLTEFFRWCPKRKFVTNNSNYISVSFIKAHVADSITYKTKMDWVETEDSSYQGQARLMFTCVLGRYDACSFIKFLPTRLSEGADSCAEIKSAHSVA